MQLPTIREAFESKQGSLVRDADSCVLQSQGTSRPDHEEDEKSDHFFIAK